MGVDIEMRARRKRSRLFATRSSNDKWLDEIEAWFGAKVPPLFLWHSRVRTEDGRSELHVNLHPAAENIIFTVIDKNTLALGARTNTVGPGYHAHVCDLLDGLAVDLKLEWSSSPNGDEEYAGDETGYFVTRDFPALQDYMAGWLNGVAKYMLGHSDKDELSNLAISMPMNYAIHHGDWVSTPNGPRSRAWVESVAQDGKNGSDFFLWWTNRPEDSMLSWVMARLWSDVCWRTPADQAERELLNAIHVTLQQLHDQFPAMELPWREWLELMTYAGLEGKNIELIRKRAGLVQGERLIGYRRYDCTRQLGDGWSIRVSAGMADGENQNGEWMAFDQTRTIEFTGYGITNAEADSPRDALAKLEQKRRPPGKRLEWTGAEDGIVAAGFVDAEKVTRAGREKIERTLLTLNVVQGGLGVCTLGYEQEADLEWAIATWHSIRHAAPEA